MRTTPNHARLRGVAVLFLSLGAAAIALVSARPFHPMLLMIGSALSLPLAAVGLAFWSLSRDRKAGVIADSKGLLLNLGHCSAFIAWDNIERVGTTSCFTSVLTLGSRRQLGIALRDVRPYIQSYEDRVPSASGPIQEGLRLVQRALRARRPLADAELALHLAASRRRTGYDVLIPEALLGQPAITFADLLDERRQCPQHGIARPLVA